VLNASLVRRGQRFEGSGRFGVTPQSKQGLRAIVPRRFALRSGEAERQRLIVGCERLLVVAAREERIGAAALIGGPAHAVPELAFQLAEARVRALRFGGLRIVRPHREEGLRHLVRRTLLAQRLGNGEAQRRLSLAVGRGVGGEIPGTARLDRISGLGVGAAEECVEVGGDRRVRVGPALAQFDRFEVARRIDAQLEAQQVGVVGDHRVALGDRRQQCIGDERLSPRHRIDAGAQRRPGACQQLLEVGARADGLRQGRGVAARLRQQPERQRQRERAGGPRPPVHTARLDAAGSDSPHSASPHPLRVCGTSAPCQRGRVVARAAVR
jgi:hypothetical protein